jgi:aspartate kinase
MSTPRLNIVVMKFGGTSVEDATAIARTIDIVMGRQRQGLSPIVVVSAMSKVTDALLASAAAAHAGRGDREPALEISSRLRVRHIETAARLVCGDSLTPCVPPPQASHSPSPKTPRSSTKRAAAWSIAAH